MLTEILTSKMLVDVVITIFGIYMLITAQSMQKTGKVNKIFFPEEDLKKCRDEKKLVRYIAPRTLIFSIVMILCGAGGIFFALFPLFAYFKYVELGVFLLFFFWFITQIRNAKRYNSRHGMP